jgi:hypothetical protein
MLTHGVRVVFLNDSVRPHTAARSRALLENFDWELFDHPLYSHDLALRDYHLFAYLKNWLGSQSFNSNELMEGVKTWLSSQATDFSDTGLHNLIPRYDSCLNSGGDFVEKYLKYCGVIAHAGAAEIQKPQRKRLRNSSGAVPRPASPPFPSLRSGCCEVTR